VGVGANVDVNLGDVKVKVWGCCWFACMFVCVFVWYVCMWFNFS
jgi:hypothetical protein